MNDNNSMNDKSMSTYDANKENNTNNINSQVHSTSAKVTPPPVATQGKFCLLHARASKSGACEHTSPDTPLVFSRSDTFFHPQHIGMFNSWPRRDRRRRNPRRRRRRECSLRQSEGEGQGMARWQGPQAVVLQPRSAWVPVI